MRDKYILAIDQGTTGTTVMIFDRDCRIISRAYSEFTQFYPVPGQVEHDAGEIWAVTIKAIREAITKAGVEASGLACIGITNQRETCLLWDRETGEPVSRAIVWQDRRTAGLCDKLRAEEGVDSLWREKTGLVLDSYFSATKLHWLMEHVPGVRDRAVKGDLAFGTIDTWLIWNLSGGRIHATDYSNASRTMMYNIHELDWDKDILRRLDIPSSVLPRIVSSSGVIGESDPSVLFGASVPIAGVAGDQQAALFGQTCYDKGMVKNTYGTGSFLLMNTGTEAVVSRQNLLSTIAWRIGDEPVQYALEGAVFITGAAIQWLRDGLGMIESASETQKMAESLNSNEDVYFVPALTGLGAPYWDPYARGMLIGLTRGTRKEHIVRAALEAICYQSRDVIEAMINESGAPLSCIRADGGAVENGFLLQFQSDILDVPVEVPEISETTALGAAFLAGLAVGIWSDRKELVDRWRVHRRYVPAMDAGSREKLYKRWGAAVARSRGWAIA